MLHILAVAHLLAIIGGVYAIYNPTQLCSKVDIQKLMTPLGYFKILTLPLCEEIVFRGILVYVCYWLDMIDYYRYISAGLFGLLHLSNYDFSQNKFLVGNQILFTTLLGYYLASLHSLTSSIMMHYFFNTVNVVAIIVVYIVKNRQQLLLAMRPQGIPQSHRDSSPVYEYDIIDTS